MTTDELRAAGYRDYGRESVDPFHSADTLFQRRFRNVRGDTLYFINVFWYRGPNAGRDAFQPECQLYLDSKHEQHVNITLGGFTSIESAEAFVARAYDALQAHPYEERIDS